MKKYNLSKIMKRAWVLVKRFKETISSALKKAWREAKMVELKGSEKQIAWAEDIRKNMIDFLKDCQSSHNADRVSRGKGPAVNGIFEKALNKVGQIESAKWFIENRYLNVKPTFLCLDIDKEINRQSK